MKRGSLLFLGTGSSTGVPMIGCNCPVCTSTNAHNKRLRPSVLVEMEGKKILIDTTPDLRWQALHNKISEIDGVLLTHTHYDHIAGIDELRVFYIWKRESIPVLLSQTTFNELKRRYDYLFLERNAQKSLAAQLKFQVLPAMRGKENFQGIPINYLTYEQGGMEVTGFRLGNLAYLSDLKVYPKTLFEDLQGVDILIVSALRASPSQMHFSLEEACDFSKKIGASQTYLMHLSHEVEHEETNKKLPKGVQLAYDGLKIGFEYE